LKPKDVKDKGISERGLGNFKRKIKDGKGLRNRSKIARVLFECCKSKSIPDRSAIQLTGLNYQPSIVLIEKRIDKIDLRMHIKPDGIPGNNGTEFRILSIHDLLSCHLSTYTIL
jgi:hypothetical protein